MRRTPLTRKTPLRRSKTIDVMEVARKKFRFAKPVERDLAIRKADVDVVSLWKETRLVDDPYRDWVRKHRCLALDSRTAIEDRACGGVVEVAHVKSRGARGGDDQVVPLCTIHHHRQHNLGIKTIQKLWKIDLEAEARAYREAWEEQCEK